MHNTRLLDGLLNSERLTLFVSARFEDCTFTKPQTFVLRALTTILPGARFKVCFVDFLLPELTPVG